MDNKSDFQTMVEYVLGLDRQEIQCIKFSNTKDNKPTWEIKLYGWTEEWEKVMKKVLDIDKRLYSYFFQNKQVGAETVIMKKVNKYKDPVISIALTRGARSIKWDTKSLGCVNEEENMLDINMKINEVMKAYQFDYPRE